MYLFLPFLLTDCEHEVEHRAERTNPTRAAKRKADAMTGNPKAKKARKTVGRKAVSKKHSFLSTLSKRQYESLRWDQDQYKFQKETDCGQMFCTIIQQKIYE